MPLNYKSLVGGLKRTIEKGAPGQARDWVRESFESKTIRPTEIDLGRVFAECFGYPAFASCRARESLTGEVMEAAGAVSTSAFTHLTNQFIVTSIRDAFMSEEFVFSALIPENNSQYIGQEKIGDISPIGDEALVVPENTEFPYAGVSEDYIHSPEAQKRGLIVALTREALFMGQQLPLVQRCENVGYSIGISKEKRIINCVIDENGGASSLPTGHRYVWRGTVISTYNNNTGSHSWDNLEGTNTLNDWTDVDAAEQLLNNMLDPNTGEPIVLGGNVLICTKQLEKTALRIRNATEINVVTPGFATSGNPTETKVGNPYGGAFEVVSSRLLAAQMATDTTWYYGDPRKAFSYKVIFPQQTIMAPPNNHDEFHRDIIRQWRSDEMGAAWTKEPRAVVKSTVA